MQIRARRADGAGGDRAAVVEGWKALLPARHVPPLPHVVETCARSLERWPLAVASSANRPLIDFVLELTGHGRALRSDGLLRGGAARKARAGRLHRGRAAVVSNMDIN